MRNLSIAVQIIFSIIITFCNLQCNLNNDLTSHCGNSFVKTKEHLFIENGLFKIEERFSSTLVVSGDEVYFNFFEELTGEKSNVIWGDVSYYKRSSDYRKDIKTWKEWYINNSCTLNTILVDSTKVLVGFK